MNVYSRKEGQLADSTMDVPIVDDKIITLDCNQKSSFSIGRNPNSDVHLPHPTVSDHHADLQLLVSAGQKPCLFLKDNKSKYGLYVEGHKIPSTFVSSNSDIQISVFKLVICLCNNHIEVRILQTEEQFTLECHKASYSISKKRLVNNIDLVIRPRDFIGLFGPSGSGKTSLLRLLTGYYKPVSGSISIGGMDYGKHFDLLKNFIAYIPQEDILHSNLTVLETIEYAAKLRLPEDISQSQLQEYIDQTIEQLNLTGIQQQKIATLSGGQKKRVNIGTELIIRPRILIADEPDAGLDPHIQDQMMEVFRMQADAGNAVIMTTHTLENFFRFDYVAIIDKGNLCFYGPPSIAMKFFAAGQQPLTSTLEIYKQLNNGIDHDNSTSISGHVDYPSKYLDSTYYKEYFKQRVVGKHQWTATDNGGIVKKMIAAAMSGISSFNKNMVRQLVILSHRHLILRAGSFKSILIYLFIPLIIAFVLAAQKVKSPDELHAMQGNQVSLKELVEKQTIESSTMTAATQKIGQNKTAKSVSNSGNYTVPIEQNIKPLALTTSQQKMLLTPKFPHVVPLTMVLAAIFCGTFIACTEISQERQIFTREHQLSVGILNYLLSKIPFLFGITFIQMSILMGIITFIYKIDNIAFNQCVMVLTLTSWASVAVGLFLSSIDKAGRNSIILSIGFIVPQIIFSGAIGPDFYSGMNKAAKIVSDCCISRWGFEGMLRIMNDSSIVTWGPTIVNSQVGFPQIANLYGINNFVIYCILCGFTLLFLLLCAMSLKLQDNSAISI